MPQSSPLFRRLPASFCAALALAGNLVAQASVRLAQETPLLKDPGGVRLGTLVAGTRFRPGRTVGDHVEFTLQGWIFTGSTRTDRREGFDLSVSATGGENIRTGPDGDLVARVVTGVLLTRVSGRGGWTQVRRTGWVARSAYAPPAVAAAPKPAPAPAPAPPRAPVSAPATAPVQRPAATAPAGGDLRGMLRQGTVIQRTPDGTALATVAGATEVTLGERDREWVKVRLEGWVRQSDVQGAPAPAPAITAAMLRDAPDRFVGQTVEWRVQFLAHQRADELRPEMPLGRPYLLVRGPLPESGFVYVLVTKEQAERLQGLKPLEVLAVVATVRAARTRYLATPVVELVRLANGK